MSGNFVIWNLTSDEADELMTLGKMGWSAVMHAENTPMATNGAKTPTFPGWTEDTRKVYSRGVSMDELPANRDTIPPHKYIQFNALSTYPDADIAAIKSSLKNPSNTWLKRLKIVSASDGGWAVKTPSAATLTAYNSGNKGDALLAALETAISIEIYKVDDQEVNS